MNQRTEDLRIRAIEPVITPAELHDEFPLGDAAAGTVVSARRAVHEVLHGRDDRLVVVIGPCSIHDPAAGLDYARRLAAVRDSLAGELLLIMRVYFEKPRTTVGWKGLINDPDLDGSFNINKGLRLSRELLLAINQMGLPAGTEYLDIVTPQYFTDLIAWGAIGARTTESQVHRELASGLSCPVGFKNGTEGNLQVAVDAVRAARHSHCFLSMTMAAHSAIFTTSGNADCHVILRGGREPNYDESSVGDAVARLTEAGVPAALMIDCSHGNSRKRPERQPRVCEELAQRIAAGDRRVFGLMIESNLESGRQDVVDGRAPVYGRSITDACVGWDDGVAMLRRLAAAVRERRGLHAGAPATG